MSYSSSSRITSKFSPQDFVPDGNLDKEIWKAADWIRFDRSLSGREHYPQSETQAATAWTSRNVYFAYRAKYDALNVFEQADPGIPTWELWNRDVVEVFINPTPERMNHYYEFEVAPNNLWLDLEIHRDKTPVPSSILNSHFAHATVIDRARRLWTCEMRIAAGDLGVQTISAGAQWRLNLFRADGLGDDAQRRLLAWSPIPTGKTFHVPSSFGVIQFAG